MTWWSDTQEIDWVRYHLEGMCQPEEASVSLRYCYMPEVREQQWAIREGLA